VTAPGYAVEAEPFEAGVARLRRMGYQVRVGRHVMARDGYFAGNDDQRAADLREMMRDPEVKAIWFARGGYGTARILDRLPWAALARNPTLLIGYSDLTALFNLVIRRTGQRCLYGPVVSELAERASYHEPSLRRALAGEADAIRFTSRQVLNWGKAKGRLVGGNLTVLTHLCGTRYRPALDDGILFLEDFGEPTYRVDRALTQLRQTGAFKRLAGVVLGSFLCPARTHFPPDRDLREVLRENFVRLGVPVVEGIRAGHTPGKRTLALGSMAELDTGSARLRLPAARSNR